jgi:hypothetical protein
MRARSSSVSESEPLNTNVEKSVFPSRTFSSPWSGRREPMVRVRFIKSIAEG